MSKRDIQHDDSRKTVNSKVFYKDSSGNTLNKDETLRKKRMKKSKDSINQIEIVDITSKNNNCLLNNCLPSTPYDQIVEHAIQFERRLDMEKPEKKPVRN